MSSLSALVVTVLVGCDPQSPKAPTALPSVVTLTIDKTQNSSQVDLGILFSDQPVYACFCLERFGIKSTEDLRAVESSCECLRPSIVSFYDPRGKSAKALRLDFLPEPKVPASDSKSTSLAIRVSLIFHSGDRREVDVLFLESNAVHENESS